MGSYLNVERVECIECPLCVLDSVNQVSGHIDVAVILVGNKKGGTCVAET